MLFHFPWHVSTFFLKFNFWEKKNVQMRKMKVELPLEVIVETAWICFQYNSFFFSSHCGHEKRKRFFFYFTIIPLLLYVLDKI